MAEFGFFEDKPEIAVAVSGGSDSMCILLLANRWAQERNGKVFALSIDHGLRKGSREELLQVRKWTKKINIEHVILNWIAKKKMDLKKKPGEHVINC